MWPVFEKAQIPLVDYEIGSKFNLMAIMKFRKIALFHHADLIHTQGPASVDALAVCAAAAAKIPFVMTRPSMMEDILGLGHWRKTTYEWVDRQTRYRAKRIIAVCEAGRFHLEQVAGVDPRKTRVVYNGIDLHRFIVRSLEEDHGKKAVGSFTIGMVAQLTSGKGWLDFIAVVGKLAHRYPGTKGIIVGDGPLRAELEGRVRGQGLSGIIRFVGHQEDVSIWLREMTLFLFTSYREGLSVSILEALGCGLPIVATEVGGIREQVEDGVNGFVLPVGDIDGLTDCCVRLLSDPEMMAAFGRSSRERAERLFSDNAMIHGYAECYREIVSPTLEEHPGGRR
jgi:glycosyltransferase involved in cell wall biosynthesis